MPRDNRIKVYRSTQGAAPPSFTSDPAVGPTFGEFAFSDGINSLFMGKDDGSLLWLGAQVTGGDIGQGLTTAVPTQKAVKDYVSAISSGYWIVRDENGLTHQIDLTDTLTLTGGAGVDVLKSSDTDTLIIKGVTATDTTLGVASFTGTHFQITNGVVTAKNIKVFSGGNISSLGLSGSLEFTGDGNSTVTLNTNQIDGINNVQVKFNIPVVSSADSTTKGIAKFSTSHFSIGADSLVSLNSSGIGHLFNVRDERGQTYGIGQFDTFTLTGGRGIDVLRIATTNDTFEILAATATNSVLGVASFAATDFSLASGAVSLTAGVVKTVNGLTGPNVSLPVAGYSTTGFASFSNTYFGVASGAVSITSGPMFKVRDEKQSTPLDIAWGDTLTLTGGPAINVFVNGDTDTIAVQGITADYTTLGFASFKQGDFVVASGAVSLTSGIVNSVNGLTGAVTVVSVLPLANTTGTTGVAAFNANYFSVSATGTVSLTTVDGGTWP